MPIRDDLVQRTIEVLARALARLAGRPDAAAVSETRAQLDEAYRVHLGTTGEVVRQLSADQLVAVISTIGRLDDGRAFLAAAMLEVDAATLAADDPAEVEDATAFLRVRALDLYLEAGLAGSDQLGLEERVRRLRASLQDHVLPEPSYGRLLRYFLHTGQYAVAEDLLFEWLEEHGPTLTLRDAGERLYDDLEGVEDAALLAGDLPRSEIPEGRRTFRASCAG
jgi:hypothetical protein